MNGSALTPSGGDASGPSEGDKPATGPGALARRVMRACDRAVLATALRPDTAGGEAGWPYPSLVMVALDHDATPLILISTLADHTKNVLADARVGLLFDGTVGLDEPLTGPRVSVLGRAVRSDEPRHRARYLARHPSATMFAGFADFAIYRVAVESAHLVAGFGRIHWIKPDDLLFTSSASHSLANVEGDIVAHMNQDHADAVRLYAQALLGLAGSDWRMIGLDPEGCDLRRGGVVARVNFERIARDAESARAELVRLVHKARRQLEDGAEAAAAPPE
ncbi:MAG TPA: DUF2470 domain-containing protein [Azospirillaceae bacterium]|nr:DUF2470 domain-containing protein [Azospirillaceae bacterium]